ncbi:hypothetical protein SLEP1_g30514 [Rubroshorea leprosula]|uniref:Uncharacterized protein n=1 Tax=Rubroshorea leprosula TaxID=152421 RepID=A0AAV5K0B3_9ROSI|nr:hypothetical protein SLEP1_g30514 [Rubroshorea leprosula]
MSSALPVQLYFLFFPPLNLRGSLFLSTTFPAVATVVSPLSLIRLHSADFIFVHSIMHNGISWGQFATLHNLVYMELEIEQAKLAME